MLGVARTLDPDVGGQRREVEAAVGQHVGRGGADQVGEQGGSHRLKSREVLLTGFSCRRSYDCDSRKGRPGDGAHS